MNETLHVANNLVHTGLGSLALIGGVVALATAKGSRLHVRGGKLFAWMMLFVILTSLIAMLNELLPLAIVLSLSVAYLVPSALLAFNRQGKHFVTWNLALMALAGVLFLFTTVQFLRFNLAGDQVVLGPLVLATMFGFLFIQDLRMLKQRPTERNFWIRRHLVRMILAFTIAVMALVRIGINFGLSLEASVILPLGIAAIAITWIYRRYPLQSTAQADAPHPADQ